MAWFNLFVSQENFFVSREASDKCSPGLFYDSIEQQND